MSLANELREKLKRDPRPDVEIAEAAKLHPVVLNRFKKSRRGLSADSMEQLAAALGYQITLKRRPKK